MAVTNPLPIHHHPQATESLPDIEMSDASIGSIASSVSQGDDQDLIESQEEEQFQETQPVDTPEMSSQQRREKDEYEATLWGFLHPCSTAVSRIDFFKSKDTYTFGRGEGNDIMISNNTTISGNHCKIIYDPRADEVSIYDLSSNGTFVSGIKIGKGKSRILREGNEITFGPGTTVEFKDIRWLYRHIGKPKPDSDSGIWTKFEMGNELGRGTFASVYRCMDRDTGKWYAVKIIQRAKFANSPVNERNFSREIGLLTGLNHPNIVRLIEVFQDPDTYYLVMEEITGGELLVRITGRHGLMESEAQYVTYQICLAMSYIHGKGITHRDLKPENVLLTSESPPVAKVADFGLAKLVDEGTFLKTMCGTPSYLAPEVVLRNPNNDQGYNHLVDSWSLGVICFAMITNTGPFIEDTTLDIATRIATRTIHWDTLVNSGRISDAGIDFIYQLLTVDPNERMSLTEALQHPWIRDLTNSLRSPPASPRRAPPGQPIVPRHYTGSGTMNTLGQSTYNNLSTVSTIANAGGSPVQRNQGLPEDYSQEFENLRLDSEGISTPRLVLKPLPSVELDVDSQGEFRVPGFSPWSQESRSQKSTRSQSAGPSGSGANGRARSLEDDSGSVKPISRKRKTHSPDGGESSPLSEPPEVDDSEEGSEGSSNLYNLPTRQAKSHKKSAGDSPAIQSNTNSAPKSKTPGTGRAGTRKGATAGPSNPTPTTRKASDKGKGKAKAAETPADEAEIDSSNAKPLRRSARNSGK